MYENYQLHFRVKYIYFISLLIYLLLKVECGEPPPGGGDEEEIRKQKVLIYISCIYFKVHSLLHQGSHKKVLFLVARLLRGERGKGRTKKKKKKQIENSEKKVAIKL